MQAVGCSQNPAPSARKHTHEDRGQAQREKQISEGDLCGIVRAVGASRGKTFRQQRRQPGARGLVEVDPPEGSANHGESRALGRSNRRLAENVRLGQRRDGYQEVGATLAKEFIESFSDMAKRGIMLQVLREQFRDFVFQTFGNDLEYNETVTSKVAMMSRSRAAQMDVGHARAECCAATCKAWRTNSVAHDSGELIQVLRSTAGSRAASEALEQRLAHCHRC